MGTPRALYKHNSLHEHIRISFPPHKIPVSIVQQTSIPYLSSGNMSQLPLIMPPPADEEPSSDIPNLVDALQELMGVRRKDSKHRPTYTYTQATPVKRADEPCDEKSEAERAAVEEKCRDSFARLAENARYNEAAGVVAYNRGTGTLDLHAQHRWAQY